MKNVLLCILLFSSISTLAQDSSRTYIFGHSLIDHRPPLYPTPSDETTVPHWLALITKFNQKHFAATGQYGFLPQHASSQPNSNWGYDSVAFVWDASVDSFETAGFHNIWITPGNFIQYQAPYLNYFGSNESPLDASRQIIQNIQNKEPSIKTYIYESWPDMAGFLNNGFPPSASEWQAYNQNTVNDFHNWFTEFHDSLELAFPSSCIKMIPVGPSLSRLLQQSPYNTIPLDSLYEDDAPHGRPTIYFLASLVSYMTIFQEKAPYNFPASNLVHSTIRNNYNAIVDTLWNTLQSFENSNNESRVFCNNLPTAFQNHYKAKTNFHIFPNPAVDVLKIKTDLDFINYAIYNISGKKIIQGPYSKTISTSSLIKGFYRIEMVGKEGKMNQIFVKE